MFLTLNIHCILHKLQNILLIIQYHKEGIYSLLGSLAGLKIELTQDRLTGEKTSLILYLGNTTKCETRRQVRPLKLVCHLCKKWDGGLGLQKGEVDS